MKPELNAEERERLLDEVVTACLEAAESGRTLDWCQVLTRYPALAPELAEFFAQHDRVNRLAAPLRAVMQDTAYAATNPTPASPSREDPLALSPGTSGLALGDYELLEVLGEGGMAVVYKARQKQLNRLVAVKVFRADPLTSAAEQQRFRNEAEMVACLDHPGIVPIYEVGEADARLYFSMKLFEGGNLARQMTSFLNNPRLAASLLSAVARAVHHAHQRGILHRDLKPSNILLDENGGPHVADFGLAKRFVHGPLPGHQEMTHSGAILGTPGYMAPEQASGSKSGITTATDVYGLGAVLYALLTGRPPFQGESVLSTLDQVRGSEPRPPRSLKPQCPRDLESIALKCLEKDPRRRYATAEAVAEDLERWLGGRPIVARPYSAASRVLRWCRRNPAVATLTATAAFMLLALVGTLVSGLLMLERKRIELVSERDAANSAREQAEQRERQLVLQSYVTNIGLAHRFWATGESGQMRLLLERCRPGPGQADLRGFEWYYLHRLLKNTPRKLAEVNAHVGDAFYVAHSPDGKLLASTGKDGYVRLWDAVALRRLGGWIAHKAEVNELAFSPDGEKLATASDDGTVVLWEVATGNPERSLIETKDLLSCLAFSKNGKVAAAGRTGTVWLADAVSGELEGELALGCGRIEGMAFAPDGRTLAAATRNAGVVLLDTEPLKRQKDPLYAGAALESVCFSPDGKILAAGTSFGGEVYLWELAKPNLSRKLVGHTATVQSVAFCPDSQVLASGGNDRKVFLWDVATGSPRSIVDGHRKGVWCLNFSPVSGQLATAGADGTVKLWEVPADVPSRKLTFGGGPVKSLAFCSSGQTFITCTASGMVQEWDALRGRLLAEAPLPVVKPRQVVISAAASKIALVTPAGELSACAIGQSPFTALSTGKLIKPLIQGGSVAALAISPEGTQVAFAVEREHPTLCRWDLTTGRVETLVELTGACPCLAYSPDGKTLAVAEAAAIRLVESSTGKTQAELAGHHGPVQCLAFSQDGELLASGSADRTIILWKRRTGLQHVALIRHRDEVQALAFAPNGLTLASADSGNRIIMWNVAEGRDLITLEGSDSIQALAFSPDNRVLVSAGSGQEATIGSIGLRYGESE
jgi:WD40 repeat protein/tRNA A-37 threonylcarbamoyl transferase component Bud32